MRANQWWWGRGVVAAVAVIAGAASELAAQADARAPGAQTSADRGALAKRLDEVVLKKGLGQFWGAVVVAKDGVPILAKGYGLADEGLRPIGPDTLFDIASCSKQFTAAAILRLEMEGRLSTDDSVAKFFPDLAGQLGERGREVHLIHLLTHTSGMADERAIQQLDFPDRDRAVVLAMTAAPNAAPGKNWDYCNAGYIVLAAVIERVSGGKYEDYLREHVFTPAGMRSTGFLDGVGLDASKVTVREVGDAASGMTPQRWTLFAARSGGEPWA